MRLTDTRGLAMLAAAGWAVLAMADARPLVPSRTGCSVEKISEFARPAEPCSLSSVTCVSGNRYWSATDWNSAIWEFELDFNAAGAPCGCRLRELFRPEGTVDVEGIAYDPLDGSVWLADERQGTIKRHDPGTGAATGEVELPPSLKNFRRDSGLESLAISADGMSMWTCLEEAAKGDSPRSTRKSGTDVRLTRFVRTGANAPWTLDGQWAYRTDSIAGGKWFNKKGADISRSGVSALCMPRPDTLLVLEREFSRVVFPRFRCRLYAVNLGGATNVKSIPSLEGEKSFVRAEKKLLFETTGFSMYEGVCADPPAPDGSVRLTLVSDGDKKTLRSVLVLKLH
jgi:hypothetical protein